MELRMLTSLYERTMTLAGSRHAVTALGAVSFAESSFFPIPPDVLLVPMVLADRARARALALWCTVTSVAGGVLGYAIGALLYESVGQWLMSLYGHSDGVANFRVAYAAWGAWIILLKGLTPIPYKIVTIASGFAGYDFLLFVLLSLITRGIRFAIVAELLLHYGAPVQAFIERQLILVTTGLVAIVVGGFVMARYVV
jgi:membrane protein YqaA with SNARE-associated domain